MAAAGRAEEALRRGERRVDVACEGRLYRGRRDKVGFDALGQGGVEAAERAMGVAADAAVAEVDGERQRRRRDRHGEVHGFAVALRRERLVCRGQLVREMEVGGHGARVALGLFCGRRMSSGLEEEARNATRLRSGRHRDGPRTPQQASGYSVSRPGTRPQVVPPGQTMSSLNCP